MNIQKIIVALLLSISFTLFSAESNQDANSLLKRGIDFSKTASYEADMSNPLGVHANDLLKESSKIYKANKDGKLLLRAEIPLNIGEMVAIINQEGRYVYKLNQDDGDIVKVEFEDPQQEMTALLEQRLGNRIYDALTKAIAQDSITSTIKGEALKNGVECYKIAIELPKDDESLAKLMNISIEQFKAMRKQIDAQAPILYEVFIGVDKPFIYEVTAYTRSGSKAFEFNFDKIVLSDNIDDELFTPPSRRDIVKATDLMQLQKTITASKVSPNIGGGPIFLKSLIKIAIAVISGAIILIIIVNFIKRRKS